MTKDKQLRQFTKQEIDEIIGEHFFYIKGDLTKKADLSYVDFMGYDLRSKDLKGANLEGSNFTNIYARDLGEVNLEDANLKGANLQGVRFNNTNLKGAILIGAKLTPEYLNEKQKNEAIFTENELKLKKEVVAKNEVVKKITKEKIALKSQTKEKDNIIENIGDTRTAELQKGFEDLKDNYLNEEKRWLIISITIFILLIVFTLLPISLYIGLLGAEKIILSFMVLVVAIIFAFVTATDNNYKYNESFFGKIDKWIANKNIIKIILYLSFIFSFSFLYLSAKFNNLGKINYESLLPFLPFEIICLTFLYFCIHQFSKAKNLRIEQQNKIAIISGYQALIAQEVLTGKEARMSYFLPNISDVLFCKANEKNDQNLPIDKVIEIAKLMKDVTK